MAKDAIGTGEFRKAFKTTGQAKEFKGTTWVVKKYFPEAILDHMSNCWAGHKESGSNALPCKAFCCTAGTRAEERD